MKLLSQRDRSLLASDSNRAWHPLPSPTHIQRTHLHGTHASQTQKTHKHHPSQKSTSLLTGCCATATPNARRWSKSHLHQVQQQQEQAFSWQVAGTASAAPAATAPQPPLQHQARPAATPSAASPPTPQASPATPQQRRALPRRRCCRVPRR